MMKYFFVFISFGCAAVCMATDLFLTPEVLLSSDTFIAKNRIYHIDGIESPSGSLGTTSRIAMERMIKGKEFKFLYRSKKSSQVVLVQLPPPHERKIHQPGMAVPAGHRGTNTHKIEVIVYHVYFGILGKDGKPQLNASVQLLKMGLAKYVNGCVDKSRGKSYRPAEEYARKNSLGIWRKKDGGKSL